MTPDQFKAWFEGFCEGITDAPTPEQWAKIKAKIADLKSVTPALNAPQYPPNARFGQIATFAPGYPQNVAGTSGEPLPERGRVFATTHRVRDLVTGADLGPVD